MSKRPLLTFDGAYFVGQVTLPAWTMPGAAAPIVGIEGPAPDGDVPISAERGQALDIFVAQQLAIRTATLEALFARYAERAGVTSVDAFAAKVVPSEVTLHENARDGVGYLGLALRCPWDVEHGLGVMLHGARVLRAGGADTAVLEWIADEDMRPLPPSARKAAPAGVARKPAPSAKKAKPATTKRRPS